MPQSPLSVPTVEAVDQPQQRFMLVLSQIPPGRVCSYGRLAELAGLGRGARLVARWLGQLPAGSRLPWHRVVNAQGRISLPADQPSHAEQLQRLQDEGIVLRNGRIDLRRHGWPDTH